jgi:polysaccharide biosynthesis transport protein
MVFDPLDRAAQLQNNRIAPVPIEAPDDEELSLQQILTVLRRRALILGGVSLASMAGITAFVMTRPPQYAGSFRLLAEPVTAGSRLADSLTSDTLQTLKPLAGGGLEKGSVDYISQIEVLKSETLLDPIIKTIQKRYPETEYKSFMKKLKVTRPKDSKILEIAYDGRDPEEIKFVLQVLSEGFIKYSVEDRQSNLRRGLGFVTEQIRTQGNGVKTLELGMERFRRENSLIDPKTVTEALSNQLQAIATEQKTNRVKLAAAQTLYTNLRQQVGMQPGAAIDVATLSEAPIYQNMLAKLRDIDSKIAIESTRFQSDSPMIQVLQDQRRELMPLLNAEAGRVMNYSDAAGSADTAKYQGTVGREMTKQLVETANQVQVLQSQDRAIDQALGQLAQQTQQVAGVSREYGQIQRDLEIAIMSLNRLLTAKENLQLESARQISPWEMISTIDDRNIIPKSSRALLLLLGALASLVVGAAAALLAEQFDRVFHTIEELKETQLPCLGMIPFNTGLNPDALKYAGAMADHPAALELAASRGRKAKRDNVTFLEAFYTLDANIRLLNSDSPIRAITVTSTTPADGKSTVSSHLAWAAVTMGRKVLLIDTDLRRPQVHLWFGVPNLRGLSNAITSDVDIMSLIQQSPQDPNLYVLTAGPTPPAPGRLLASNKMRQFIDRLKLEFDLVICDAPPLMGFADPKLVASHTDGVLMVVGLGKTDRTHVMQSLDDLRNTVQAPVLGVVANGMKRYTSNYYSYYNRYYDNDGDDGDQDNKPLVLAATQPVASSRNNNQSKNNRSSKNSRN